MNANQASFPIATMARVLGVSKAGYHAWLRRPPSSHAVADEALLKRVRTVHATSRQTYGAPRVHAETRLRPLGRSRGGRTTKIHALVDGQGRPVALAITPGQRGDAPAALGLLGQAPPSQVQYADAAYDSNPLREFLLARGTLPVIPNNPTRKHPHPFKRDLDNVIERSFCRLKDVRGIATRYDRLTCT